MSVPPLLGENWTPGFSTTTIMGCNLCTLQKREEHYKLLYEIAQVSGGTADSGISCVCVLLCMIHYACVFGGPWLFQEAVERINRSPTQLSFRPSDSTLDMLGVILQGLVNKENGKI